jgi:hypothetical protein
MMHEVHDILRATDSGSLPGHDQLASTLNRNARGHNQSLQTWSESRKVTHYDLGRLRRLLECRLAWYGLQSVEVGSIRELTEDTVFVDLHDESGVLLCRVEVDCESGAIRTLARRALNTILGELTVNEFDDWTASV